MSLLLYYSVFCSHIFSSQVATSRSELHFDLSLRLFPVYCSGQPRPLQDAWCKGDFTFIANRMRDKEMILVRQIVYF